MGARRQAREYALQALYLVDLNKMLPDKALKCITHGEKLDNKTIEFAKYLLQGTLQHAQELDETIVRVTKNWEMSRMAALDRNLLRLSAYELIYEIDTPLTVIIDEAVEIAKIYSTPESGKFVNGILDKIKSERNKNSDSNASQEKP